MPADNSQIQPAHRWKIRRAQITLFAEKFWPALLPALGAISLFLLISLFDLWQVMPGVMHYAVLGALIGFTVYSLVRDLSGLTWPTEAYALHRLELDSNLPHAPLQSLKDRPFSGTASADNPLWQAHLARMRDLGQDVRVGKARSITADQRDPWGLRYAIILLMAFGLFISWGDMAPRLAMGLSPQMNKNAPVSVDLWIDPPGYTGKAPVVLLQSASPPQGNGDQINVPQGSVLHARIAGSRGFSRGRIDIHTTDGRTRTRLEDTDNTLIGETELTANSAIVLSVQGRKSSWPVVVTPDRPPSVVFREAPSVTEENRVLMVVEIRDDYGITAATAKMTLDPEQPRPLDAPALSREALTSAERVSVTTVTGIEGPRTVDIDLTDHPWAGLDVLIRLEVTDGAGNVGETLSEKITLPEREFFNPLAQAVIFERRNLAVAPEHWRNATRALGALTLAPDRFFDRPVDYLLLRTAYWDMLQQSTDLNVGMTSGTGSGDAATLTEVRGVVDSFWPLALQLEDQALELARRALEAAQSALREALERGAPPGEIASLVEDLRLAMQNYIQALAESGQAVADQSAPSEELGQSDLDEMLDSINDLTQSGANNAARQMLSSLEQMLENLQISGQSSGDGSTGRSGQQGQSGDGEAGSGEPGNGAAGGGPGSQSMGAAGELIGRQRELADETFDALREQFGLDGTGTGARSPGDLRRDQQALADELSDVLEDLGDVDASENGEDIRRAFEEARDFMNEAVEGLSADNPNMASQAQEGALDALRRGAEGIAEEVMRAQYEGEDGQNEQGFAENVDGTPAEVDPLGRPYGAAVPGNAIGIPDLSDPERARELVERLRQRLSEPGLSRDEIEYLERLLQRF
ncbi:MAG: TIGR02302 family protein [Aquisalinus sp.]|nr:TIGR02302 family protein [Aquisalinus sp.]